MALVQMAGLLRRGAIKLIVPSAHLNYARRLSPSFLPVRGMASSKLFIGGLSFHTDEEALRNAFAVHGEVLEAKIIMDRNTGMSRGFGFVTFNSESEAETAFKGMDGKVVNGRVIRVDYASVRPMGPGFGSRPVDGYSPGGRFNPDFGPGTGQSYQDPSHPFAPDVGSQTGTGPSYGMGSSSGYRRSTYMPSENAGVPSNPGMPGTSTVPSDGFGLAYPRAPSAPSAQDSYGNYSAPLDNMGPPGNNPLSYNVNPTSRNFSDDMGPPGNNPSYNINPTSRNFSDDMGPPYPRRKPPYPSSSTVNTQSSSSSNTTFGFANDYILVGTPVPGGPVNVRSERGLSKEIGPYYPNGGYSYSFEAVNENAHPTNSDSSPKFPGASNSDAGPTYAQGGS